MTDDEKLRAEIKRLRNAIKDQDDRLAAATERLEQAAGSRSEIPLRPAQAARVRMRQGYASTEREAAWVQANPNASFMERQEARRAGFPTNDEDDDA